MKTERLILRPLELADASRLVELAGDWDVARQTARIPHPYSLVAADQWISSLAHDEVVFAIDHDGAMIGACGYVLGTDETAEIGYWIGKPYWGRGFATEAARALVEHCFHEKGLKRLDCCHFEDNLTSRRVIEKLGFKALGPCTAWCEARGVEVPTRRYEQKRSRLKFWKRKAA